MIKRFLESILIRRCIILACFFVSFMMMEANATKAPLPANQAFVFSVSFISSNKVIANWDIAPGYYLYRERVHIALYPRTDADIAYPKAVVKTDFTGHKYEAYAGNLQVPIELHTKPSSLQLRVHYQGCSQDGFCYPPLYKELQLNFIEQTALSINTEDKNPEDKPITKQTSFYQLLTDQNGVHNLLAGQNVLVLLIIFTCLGILLAFTPCVLPMVPILTGIIVGQHITNTKKAFFLSLSYVLGGAITYAMAGLLAALVGGSIQGWLQTPIVISIVSALFVLLALSLFGLYHLQLPRRLHNKMLSLSHKQQGGKYLGVFIMGMISTLIVSPCVTAPLVGVLMYIGETGDKWLGITALFMMGIGMGLPLLLIGISAGKWLPNRGPWMEAIKKAFGLLMLAMAIWLVSRILPATLISLLWGFLLLCIALFLSVSLPHILGFRFINRSVGVMVALFGVFAILNGMGVSSAFRDIIGNKSSGDHPFMIVHNMTELTQKLALAQAAKKPVILDFYADWCESCVTMDKNVFASPSIKEALNRYVLLRADLTANTSADEELLRHFNVIAPPTVLFFDANGQELNTERLVGEVNAKELLTRLDSFFPASCEKTAKC